VKWTWQDIAELARDLARQHPDRDPLSVPAPELKRLVTSLPTFGDEPEAATSDILEAIQAAWYEETME
jgi:FeS assembly protein IscX